MSFLLQEYTADPSGDVPVLNISPERPLELADISDITNNVRYRHDGIIAFPRGSIRPGAVHEAQVKRSGDSKNPATSGWHMHGGFYAINLSRGSDIPTIFANPTDISKAMLEAIKANMPALQSLDQQLPPLPQTRMDLDERITKGPAIPLRDQIGQIMDTLSRDKEATTLDQLALAWNALRILFVDGGDNVNSPQYIFHRIFFNIIQASQTRIPANRVLAMSPSKFDAYVIPPSRAHARSLREGRVYRPSSEQNVFIGIDRKTGQPWIPKI